MDRGKLQITETADTESVDMGARLYIFMFLTLAVSGYQTARCHNSEHHS
jgi:hypothetical protein